MFGGFQSYSTAAEYAARAKAQEAKRAESEPAHEEAKCDHGHGTDGSVHAGHSHSHAHGGHCPDHGPAESENARPGQVPPPVMGRDELVSFFRETGAKLADEDFVAQLVAQHDMDGGEKISELMLELQKDEVRRRGFDYDAATEAMRYVPQHFPRDEEVAESMKNFMIVCRDVHARVLKEAPVELEREGMLDFLSGTAARVLTDATRDQMLGLVAEGKKMHHALHAIQLEELSSRGVSEKGGKDAVARIQVMFPRDKEMQEALRAFEAASHRALVLAMRARPIVQSELQRSGPIPDEAILEWFQACNWYIELDETKAELAALFKSTGKPPAERICDFQREMFEFAIGVEREHGCRTLSNLETRLQSDPRKFQAFRHFLHLQSMACQRAMGKEDEIRAAEAEDRERMARQQRLQRLQAKAMLEEHGPLMAKIDQLTPVAEKRARAMGVDERRAFAATALRRFATVLRVKNSVDPAEKMTKLGELSDEQLGDFLLLQTLLSPAAKAMMMQQQGGGGGHSHSHGHGQSHGHSHDH